MALHILECESELGDGEEMVVLLSVVLGYWTRLSPTYRWREGCEKRDVEERRGIRES
jgi:hypothetical protein